jgi:fructose/tagatose bisphosphate aldolase
VITAAQDLNSPVIVQPSVKTIRLWGYDAIASWVKSLAQNVDVPVAFVRFFCKLRESYPLTDKLHIILDGAGYHRSDLVKDAAFVLSIELH